MGSPKQQQHHHHHHHHRPPPPPVKNNKKKQRPLVLRRAMLHSCLCFLVGLLTGLAPSGWADVASRAAADANAQVFRALHAGINHTTTALQQHLALATLQQRSYHHQQEQQQLLMAVTTTAGAGSSERERRAAGLMVEAAREAAPTARLLRRTGVVYQHLTYADNFTADAWEEERHHQRNVALGHIEQHRLRGVVLFAGLADVYDLRLLEELRRQIRTLGAWPVATVCEQERRVAVEGPVVVFTSTTTSTGGATASAWFSSGSAGFTTTTRPSPSHDDDDDTVHGFAFASDLLWDPARWDRFPTSEPDHSQDSIKFVQRLLMEDYNKTRVIIVPADHYSNSSQIMAWRVDTTLL